MENLLYYPYINLPKSDWSIRTLLYYNKIGSIIPNDYLINPERFDPHMRELHDRGLVEAIVPNKVLDSPYSVASSFRSYVSSEEFKPKKRRASFKRLLKEEKSVNYRFKQTPKIHVDKFDNEVFRHLKDEGLAKEGKKGFYLVEEKTAEELMTFLASVLSLKLNYLPVSDHSTKRMFRPIGLQSKDYKIYRKENKLRELILDKLIPYPEDIDIDKIATFKRDNQQLLKSFKNQIELIVLNPVFNKSSDLLEEKIRELIIQKDEISAKLGESKLGIRLVNASGVVGSLAGLESDNPWMIGLSSIGLLGSIYNAIQSEQPDTMLDSSGMKYLALVDQKVRKPVSSFAVKKRTKLR